MELRTKSTEDNMDDNLDIYVKYWRPFGELLTDMERIGFKVDIKFLKVLNLFNKLLEY
jgi:DNA polymerase I-like protein with 3'-5' exonuclease and polymerase domains